MNACLAALQHRLRSTYCPIEQTQSLVLHCSWFDTIITMPGYYHDPFYRSLLEENTLRLQVYFTATGPTKFLINPRSGEGKHKSSLVYALSPLQLFVQNTQTQVVFRTICHCVLDDFNGLSILECHIQHNQNYYDVQLSSLFIIGSRNSNFPLELESSTHTKYSPLCALMWFL